MRGICNDDGITNDGVLKLYLPAFVDGFEFNGLFRLLLAFGLHGLTLYSSIHFMIERDVGSDFLCIFMWVLSTPAFSQRLKHRGHANCWFDI